MTAEAAEAAAHWGGAQTLRLIRDRENAVFEAMLPTGRAALRLHRVGYQSEAAIRSELWWCAALADAGAPVPRPVPARDGELLHRLSSGRLASVIGWIDGPPLGEAGVPLAGRRDELVARFRAVGDLVARFHEATDALTLPDWFTRPRWDVPGLTGETPFWGRFWDHPDLTADERETLLDARRHIAATLGARGGDFGLIHADVLRENVLFAPDGPCLIDFDDAGFGYRAFDLGTVLSQTLAEPHLPALAQALVQGYAARRPLDPSLIPTVTLARCCASVGWTMPRLAPGDPIRRRHIERAVRLARAVLGPGVDWWG
ncbi:MAG: phosphotransferase enzyme family protein [Gemmobacter sp.]|uniref:phosphotransferase enzyme family protein n=1 Tax=Gemmobacter sp. TaxID=1898957 RepID=UPI00391D94EB